jgi:catalase
MTTTRPKTTPRPRRDAARAGSDSAKQEQLEPHREVPDEQFLTTDQGLRISKDPDFHRRDLWEAIEAGAFPEWELGLQIIPEADEDTFDFDLLDPTKLVPEELVPVERVGRLTLDRNPDSFFAETEQVAFHPGHVVPGIDFTNDPLLQGRLFSYTDTQLLRLGGPNFHEIPINRPVAPLHNNQRDGLMRQTINTGRAAYHPNTIGGGCPMQAGRAMGGFVTHPQVLEGRKVRERGEKFFDHFSQATLFWNSQSEPEKQHIVQAFQFELGKLDRPAIRERMGRCSPRWTAASPPRWRTGWVSRCPLSPTGC